MGNYHRSLRSILACCAILLLNTHTVTCKSLREHGLSAARSAEIIFNVKESFAARDILPRATWLPCLECEVGVTGVKELLKLGMSYDLIAADAKLICEIFRIESADVCHGIVDVAKDEFLDVLANVTLPTPVVCYYLLGLPCSGNTDTGLDWNVTLPEVPKPPVVPPAPPASSAPKLRVLQLSDIHIDLGYKPGSNADCGKPLCCQNGTPKGEPAGKWGDYRGCDTPPWTFEQLLKNLSQNQFDYILWTGDLTSHKLWTQSKTEVLLLIDYITELFNLYFPNTPVYPALGNHEGVPVNSFPPLSVQGHLSVSWLYEYLGIKWKHWLPPEAVASISRGGFYTALLHKGFRIVSLNMNFCHRGNWWLMLNSTDPAAELQWLVGVLQTAETNGEKVQIIGHIPPGLPDCIKTWSWNYYRIVNRYESTIVGQFFGHVHTDWWQVFYDENDLKRPLSVAYLSPSVTTYTDLNPGYRVYTVDGFYSNSSFMVLDHETFIMNLTEANRSDRPVWVKEYSAKVQYGMAGLSPQDWELVTRRLLQEDDLFNKFYSSYYKSNLPTTGCDGDCRKSLICGLRSGRSYDPGLCRWSIASNSLSDDAEDEAFAKFLSWQRANSVC